MKATPQLLVEKILEATGGIPLGCRDTGFFQECGIPEKEIFSLFGKSGELDAVYKNQPYKIRLSEDKIAISAYYSHKDVLLIKNYIHDFKARIPIKK